jgi:hypothetical protein
MSLSVGGRQKEGRMAEPVVGSASRRGVLVLVVQRVRVPRVREKVKVEVGVVTVISLGVDSTLRGWGTWGVAVRLGGLAAWIRCWNQAISCPDSAQGVEVRRRKETVMYNSPPAWHWKL